MQSGNIIPSYFIDLLAAQTTRYHSVNDSGYLCIFDK